MTSIVRQSSIAWATTGLAFILGCSSSSDSGTDPAQLTLVAVTSTALSGTVGARVNSDPTVRVKDQSGKPRAGVLVTFDVTGGGTVGVTFTETDHNGIASATNWTLGSKTGTQTVTAYAVGGLTSIVFTATAVAAPMEQMQVQAGNLQAGITGSTLQSPLAVRLSDRYGNVTPGVVVTFAVLTGGGSIEGTTATSNAQGIATSGLWTLGDATGAQLVRARAEAVSVVFTAEAWGTAALTCADASRCGKIAFVSNRDGNREIYSVNPDGSELARLTSNAAIDEQPAWSPDGRRIAFISDRSGNPELYVMDADGSNVTRRTYAGAHTQDPAWSPDGRKIAYATLSNGSLNLWVVSPDASGPGPTLLLEQPGWEAQPSWSPDGRLALVSDWLAYDFVYDIFVADSTGGGFRPLTGNISDHVDYVRPSWSPNGSRMAVTIVETSGIDQWVTRLGVMNADGTGLRQLVRAGTWTNSSWSPDGSVIAYTSGTGNKLDVSWVKADGTSSGLIVRNGWNPDWRR